MKINEAFSIYADRLRDGQIETIDEAFSPEFLDVSDKDLTFTDVVKIEGETYLADSALVLHFSIKAHGLIPCLICNEPVKVNVQIPDFYHLEPLNEIKSGVFSFKDIVRDAILLETPAFAECNNGNCRKRSEVQKYMRKSEASDSQSSEESYHPFADL
jgi:uncharacterized metal-binding protein YceD (DUF177 family)